MDFVEFEELINAASTPVILLEGTRTTTPDDETRMQSLAHHLATRFPDARFRSGNAPGSDAAFAAGIAALDATRLELMVPYATHRAKERPQGARVLALENASGPDELVSLTLRFSPFYETLAKQTNRQAQAKFAYLLRDTLKVTGDIEADFAPATAGIFFVNEAKPTQGGTAHTLRVCEAIGATVVTQTDWREWEI